jgi:hypothetical protein
MGQIDGMLAMAVTPIEYSSGQAEAMKPDGFEAHLVLVKDRESERVFPCGSWFRPKAGWYRMWVEGEWAMTPYSTRIAFPDVPFLDRGLVAGLPVVGAGRVLLPETFQAAPHLTLRLLHAEEATEHGYPRWELSRSRDTTDVGAGLQLPAGRAIASVWDQKSKRFVALSRPFHVAERRTVAAPLEAAPERGTHLVLVLERRGHIARTQEDYHSLELTLKPLGSGQAPDVIVQATNRIFAVWYDLDPGTAVVEAKTNNARLMPLTIELRNGSIERVAADLEELVPLPWESTDSKLPWKGSTPDLVDW